MKKIYYEDTYLKTLVSKPQDATIFYPECGGQPGDRGFANDIRIVDTRKSDNGDSVYVLEDGQTLNPEKEYTFSLDWQHRYRYMKMHTCQHMLSGLLYTMFNIGTVAVHLGEEYLTIEVSQDNVPKETIDSLINRANQIIWEGHKVNYYEKSHAEAEAMGLRRSIKVEGDVRLVEIEGVDLMACGGVHVSNTNEIQLVLYYKQELIRGHVRMFFKCAEDAVNYTLSNQKIVHSLVEQLGCSDTELVAKVSKTSVELAEKAKFVQEYTEKMAAEEIKKALTGDTSSFETKLELDSFVKASENYTDLALCVVRKTETNNQWLIVLKGKFEKTDFNRIRADLLGKINAKGGGRTPVFRGIATCSSEEITSLTEDFKNWIENC